MCVRTPTGTPQSSGWKERLYTQSSFLPPSIAFKLPCVGTGSADGEETNRFIHDIIIIIYIFLSSPFSLFLFFSPFCSFVKMKVGRCAILFHCRAVEGSFQNNGYSLHEGRKANSFQSLLCNWLTVLWFISHLHAHMIFIYLIPSDRLLFIIVQTFISTGRFFYFLLDFFFASRSWWVMSHMVTWALSTSVRGLFNK